MAGNETMIDAPVTPAPLFAYRALRGMFFGSPDTPAAVINPHQNQSAIMTNRKSPTKILQMEAQVRLTPPQKRKRESNNVLSPTKSCLRTPGAMTPRRAKLKEVNVTFKDIRMSISPELSRKGTEIQDAEADKENQNPTPVKIDTNTTTKQNTAQPTKTSRVTVAEISVSKTNQPPASESATRAKHAFNLEEYMAKTDVEMKKLIRYGRKMRDYARQQEDENTKLNRLVDELRQENEYLKKGSISQKESLQVKDTILFREVPSGSATTEDKLRSSSQIKATKETASFANIIYQSSKQTQLALDEFLNLDENRDAKVKSASQPFRLHIPTTSKSNTKPKTVTDNQAGRLPTSDENLTSEPESKSNSPHPHPILPIQISTTGSTRLASNRLIAARARIQKKAELRKSSLESAGYEDNPYNVVDSSAVGIPAENENERQRESGRGSISNSASRTKKTRTLEPAPLSSRDNSVLDWAAL